MRQRSRNPKTRWIRWLLVAALPAAASAWLALPWLSARPALHRWIEARVATATGLDVRFKDLRISADLSAEVDALSVAAPGAVPFLEAARIRISPHLPAVTRDEAAGIRIEGAHVFLNQLPTSARQEVPNAPDTPTTSVLPSGTSLAATLHGQRIELIDGFVHFGSPTGPALGPLTLAIESLDLDQGLRLGGTAALGGEGSAAHWSAELGPTLAESQARVRADAAFGTLVRTWSDLVLPASLQDVQAALKLELRGTDETRIAVDIDAGVRPTAADKVVAIRGSGEIDLKARSVTAKVTAKGIDLQSADATRAASGLRVVTSITAQQRDGDTPRLDLAIDLSAGELLWERAYVNLGEHPVEIRGRLEQGAKATKLSRTTLSVGGVGSLRGSGTIDRSTARSEWQIDYDLPGLDALFRLAVRDPLSDGRPVLARTEVTGRAIGAITLAIDSTGGRRLTGSLDLANAAVTVADPEISLTGIDLHLPLDFRDGDAATEVSRKGWLHLARIAVGDVAIERVDLPLTVVTNQIGIAEPVRISLFGGRIDLTTLRGEALASSAPRAALSLALHDLDFEPLSLAVGLPRMVGRVTGAIPNLTLEGETLRSEGEIRIDVFAGTLRLRDLRVDELASPVPALRLDLDFADISLRQLTRTFEVGRISGTLGGRVDDLVLVDGQPVSFEAQVATTPRSGVAQRISVRAIRQISILGGSGGDPISQRVLGLFDEYRYAKMGFRCRLENDRFELRGVEESDGQEYLVLGATLPPRVSVVSHTRVIAFSELVRRLARVASVEETAPPADAPDEAPEGADQEPGKGQT